MNGRSNFFRIMLVGIIVVSAAATAQADSRTDRLVQLLTTSPSYRVRVQSALSLGRLARREAVSPLIEALADAHPAVRAAAALSLGRIGSPAADAALAQLARDPAQPEEVSEQAQRSLERIRQLARR